jgi:excisionase family DNA binding protein
MRIPELAEYLQVSQSKLYRLIKAKRVIGFPAYKVGHQWWVDLNRFQDWMVESLERRVRHS